MKCPFCSCEDSKVIDSRPTDEGERIRRRRECNSCGKRFTTYEVIESVPGKLLRGMLRACEKRPVSLDQLDHAVNSIEAQLQNGFEREISSDVIGEMAMDKLRELDEVAYVRFASVYRQFKDINTFMEELSKILKDNKSV